jgi:succinoglycan biosynthesis protein ExoM
MVHHIAVCIITYRRPAWLGRLLQALGKQETADAFTYSIVVVDDDPAETARAIVAELRPLLQIPLQYYPDSHQNLARARNTAISHATGTHLAFIDDDEFPERDWLLNLYTTWRASGAAGVLGPVIAHFEADAPAWLTKSRVCQRPRYPTGRRLQWTETRTGNVLLSRDVLATPDDLFDIRFRTHGEDLDFFRRLIQKGHEFVWCDEAPVFETQPSSRLTRRYHLRRALIRGSVAYSHAPSKLRSVLTSLMALALYLPALPGLQLLGHHHFMKYCIKTCDHLGKLFACAGYRVEQHLRV